MEVKIHMKSIDALVDTVLELKKNGLSESEISDELHLSVALSRGS